MTAASEPESMTIVTFAGGCMDFRLHVLEGKKAKVETWHMHSESETGEFVQDTYEGRTPYFDTTEEAWNWIGVHLALVKPKG
jgi:hypothetical protein